MDVANRRRADVIIIGAGFSGLSAGKLLTEAGQDVLVLEARDRVGGRVYTRENPKCKKADMGAAYVGIGQNRLLRLLKEYNLELYDAEAEGKELYYQDGKTTRYEEVDIFFQLSYLDVATMTRRMQSWCSEIPLEAPWKAPKAALWDKMTLKEFFDEHLWTRDGRLFFDLYVQSSYCAEPHEISLLWFLWTIAMAGGQFRKQTDDVDAIEQWKVVEGTQSLPDKMAEQLGIGEKVLLNRAVTKVQQNGDGVTITDSNGDTFECDYVIMAIPPAVQTRIQYSPPLPTLRNQLLQRSPMGTIFKTFVYYDKAYWTENGDSGTATINIEGTPYLIPETLDCTQPDGSHPALMGVLVAEKARSVSMLTKEERRDRIAQQYAEVFGIPELAKPIHYEEYEWSNDEWSGGAFFAVLPPGVITEYKSALYDPIGRMYLAGTETATEYQGFMDGAIQAGERAAREILHQYGKIGKDKIWQKEPMNEEHTLSDEADPFVAYSPTVPVFLSTLGVVGSTAACLGAWYLHSKTEVFSWLMGKSHLLVDRVSYIPKILEKWIN